MLLWQSNKNGYRRSLEYNRRPGWQRSRMCMCAWGIPKTPEGAPLAPSHSDGEGGIEGYQGPPLILFVRRMFRKGATHWVTGKQSEEGKKIYAALLDVMPKKGRTGYKETWKRRNFVREKIRKLASIWIYFFLYKILKKVVKIQKLLPVQITLT